MTEPTKTCRASCGETKPVTEFGRHSLTPDGYATYCRSCEADRAMWPKHGMTRAQKTAIAEAQGGCAICRRPEPGGKGWVVDHDHSCCPGEVSCIKCRRGVLCQWCNNVLGYAFDNPKILEEATAYLHSLDREPVVALPVRSSESVERVASPVLRTRRTNKTDVEPHSPTSDISPFVTHARAYGFAEGDR